MNQYQQAQFHKKQEKWEKRRQPSAYLYQDHPSMVWFKKRRVYVYLGMGTFMPSSFVFPQVLTRKAYGPEF